MVISSFIFISIQVEGIFLSRINGGATSRSDVSKNSIFAVRFPPGSDEVLNSRVYFFSGTMRCVKTDNSPDAPFLSVELKYIVLLSKDICILPPEDLRRYGKPTQTASSVLIFPLIQRGRIFPALRMEMLSRSNSPRLSKRLM